MMSLMKCQIASLKSTNMQILKLYHLWNVKSRQMRISNSHKKFKTLLTKKIKTPLSKMTKTHLIKKIKTILTTMINPHSKQLFVKRLLSKLSCKKLCIMINFYTCVIHHTHTTKILVSPTRR
jgi:hypothetical protein